MERKDELRAILDEVRSLRNAIDQLLEGRSTLPRVMTPQAAAVSLGVSSRTLARMIACGDLMTVTVGKRQMVPATELVSISTPPPAAGVPATRTTSPVPLSLQAMRRRPSRAQLESEAARVRLLVRRRRH